MHGMKTAVTKNTELLLYRVRHLHLFHTNYVLLNHIYQVLPHSVLAAFCVILINAQCNARHSLMIFVNKMSIIMNPLLHWFPRKYLNCNKLSTNALSPILRISYMKSGHFCRLFFFVTRIYRNTQKVDQCPNNRAT